MADVTQRRTAADYATQLGWTWNETRHEWEGLCPCHDPSGTHTVNAGLKDEHGTILWKCFAGCTFVQFLDMIDLVPPRSTPLRASSSTPRKEIARYAYTDEHDDILYYNLRYEPKSFKMAKPEADGSLTWRTKDLPRRVVYRLSSVLENHHTLFFVEGEKDVQALEALGIRATCIAGGADAWTKYRHDYIAQLTGQDLVILPDNDTAGMRLAGTVAKDMHGHAGRVRTLTLPGIPPAGDVSDWIASGGTADELWALLTNTADTARPAQHTITRINANALRDMHFNPLQWFASGLLHEGNVIFAGKSKRGKSILALNMALNLATGADVFGQYEVSGPVKVAYCALEDGARRIHSRLQQMDRWASDLGNLEVIFEMPPFAEGGVDALRQLIEEGFQVIIIDVLAKVEGGSKGRDGQKSYLETYATFAPLQALRNQYTFALIMITHLRKSEAEELAEGVMGSTAYVGAQDAVWVFSRKYAEDTAYLEVSSKDMQEKRAELHFDAGNITWEFIGEGDEHFQSKEKKDVMDYLKELHKPQSVREIREGMGLDTVKDGTLQKRLMRMAKDGLIFRTDHGKYAALYRSSWEND